MLSKLTFSNLLFAMTDFFKFSVRWPPSGAPMLRCTICCRCCGLVPKSFSQTMEVMEVMEVPIERPKESFPNHGSRGSHGSPHPKSFSQTMKVTEVMEVPAQRVSPKPWKSWKSWKSPPKESPPIHGSRGSHGSCSLWRILCPNKVEKEFQGPSCRTSKL